MRVGIVQARTPGSPRCSTLTRGGAETGDYPFTTIDPNVAVVPIPDERLERVAETVGSSKVVLETIEFHDIAGLVRGASGEASATASCRIERPTRSATSCERTRPTASRIPRGGSTPATTSS